MPRLAEVLSVFLTAFIWSVLLPMPVLSAEVVPHPSVVCVVAWEKQSASRGSGSLIQKNDHYGFILTNWHVVHDSTGIVIIKYADDSSEKGVVVAVDSLWDLALIATSPPPKISPVPIAKTAPQRGDPLWIAGYGAKDLYKMSSGYCTKYVAPSASSEREMVELTVAARHGDSGGPIFNRQGELAGVLFGTNNKITVGSYCGRIWKFLHEAAPYVRDLPQNGDELLTLAMMERQTILQRGMIMKSPLEVNTPPVSSAAAQTVVQNHSSSSSFGGGGRKKHSLTVPLQPVDPFLSVESLQPHLGFQGYKFVKRDSAASPQTQVSATISSPELSALGAMSLPPSQPSPSAADSSPLPPLSPYPASTASSPNDTIPNHAMNTFTGGTPPRYSGYSSPPTGNVTPPQTSIPPTAGSGIRPANRGTDNAVSSYVGPGSSGTSAVPSSAYSSPPAYSSNAPVTSAASIPAAPMPSLPAVSAVPTPSRHESYRPATPPVEKPYHENGSPPSTGRSIGNGTTGGGTSGPRDYFGGSYSRNTSAPSYENSFTQQDNDSPRFVEDAVGEKYASSTAIHSGNVERAEKVTRFTTLKVIGIILVIFFILFHAVKLMSIIEEP
ncbi:MAG: trypsin-like peptidase domain-containing protein [Planctomycetaceae bacterium]|jgi:hypothetical protein|nr:trypsin-like peptidase domain-containing protein [Planctomycetaceae bacterium]